MYKKIFTILLSVKKLFILTFDLLLGHQLNFISFYDIPLHLVNEVLPIGSKLIANWVTAQKLSNLLTNEWVPD